MMDGRKTTATLTGEKVYGLWPSAVPKGAFYYPKALKHGCRRTGRGTNEWLLITLSQLLQEALSTEKNWCVKTQLPINVQKEQQIDQYVTWRHITHI